MKKLFNIIFSFLIVFFVSVNYVKAECNDEELNEWATKVEAVFTENTITKGKTSKYAYFLSINPYRDDVRIVVTDGSGNKANGEMFEEINLYAVGAFTNLEEETYTIEVFGDKNSKCNNSLLKKLTYTVPRLNRRIKDARCEGNTDLEICKTFTNSTKNMTEEEFNTEISKYIKEKEDSESSLLSTLLSYGLFIILPVLVVGFIYLKKIKKVKKEERDR